MAEGGYEQRPLSRWERLRRLDRSLIEAQRRSLSGRQLMWARVMLLSNVIVAIVLAVVFSPAWLIWIGAAGFQFALMPPERRREVLGLRTPR